MTVVSAPYRPHGVGPTVPRLAAVAVVMLAVAGLLGWRLVDIQVAHPDRYLEHGRTQRVVSDQIPAERGAIVDRNGLLLAGSVVRPTVTANPQLVEDPQATARELAPVLGVPFPELVRQLERDSFFSFLARQVDDATAEQVAELGLAGIFLDEEQARTNPGGDHYARALLGRTDLDTVGISGLEAQYDDILTGDPGDYVLERATNGSLIPSGQHEVTPAVAGNSLVLSIDQTLQFTTEQLLVQHVSETGAAGGVVVLLDNTTGDVLSMATVARDDDDNVVPSSDNRAVTWAYEPGSIAKPLTFAGVLEAGVGGIHNYLDVPDALPIYDATFTDVDPHPPASWNMVDILQKSSNVGTIMWAQQLGSDGLHDTLEAFGLGQPSALDLPGETAGRLISPDEPHWSGTSLPTIAIGQGVSVTPLQMAEAYATIANGGMHVPARVVNGVQDSSGTFTPVEGVASERVISEATAAEVTEMLTAVVADGTGFNAAIPGYQTAGKTGTAWKPQPGGGYLDEAGNRHLVASFAGFLPADDPAVTIVVVIDEPIGDRSSGGQAAAPVFADLSRYALRHLRIPPTTETAVSDQDNVRSETLAEQAARAEAEAEAEAGSAASSGAGADAVATGPEADLPPPDG